MTIIKDIGMFLGVVALVLLACAACIGFMALVLWGLLGLIHWNAFVGVAALIFLAILIGSMG